MHWTDKGCELCRQAALGDLHSALVHVADNAVQHSLLYKCSNCGTYWEMTERFIYPVTQEWVAERYPEVTLT